MPGMNLTKPEAQQRAAAVRHVSYHLDVDFTLPGQTFRTVTSVGFEASQGATTFIDCVAQTVHSVTLNGVLLPPDAWTEGRIELTGLSEANTLTIDAEFAYRTDGQGIHRFVDPESGETYLYSQFAAVDARSAFACFDQPDIRATFTVEVVAPAHWVVVSNTPVVSCEDAPGAADAGGAADATGATATAAKRWAFGTTAPLPTYVAAIVAGPYAWEEGVIHSRKGEIPARVYGRANLAAHLDADEMIATAQAGMELYERVFDTEYPYEKYDQVFVPEYNLGAMENVGCVTFSEDRLLFRSRPSDALRQQRVNIVLHELSHMWFGNLVTMRWWDDLWLNESFAEFVGTWATEQATPWKDAWVTFGASRKSVAYVQDQLPTTHAIVTEIPDVEATVSAFDMITYAKGASALKQLAAHVGEDAFFAGVASYLKRYAFGNATLSEFLAEVEAAAGRPLDAWASAWLETPGVTTLRPVIVEADQAADAGHDRASARGILAGLAVAEDVPAAYPVQRPHAITVAGYMYADGAFAHAWSLDTQLSGALTDVPGAVGLERPDLLLLNDKDRTYAKAQLDAVSLATVAAHIGALDDAAALASVLDALWHMCRDAAMPATTYIDAVLDAMPVMTNSETIESHQRSLAVAIARYVPPSQTREISHGVAERMWTIASNAPAGSDLQLQALKGCARFAADEAQAAQLADVLDGATTLQGLTIDSDLAWDLLAGMVAVGAAGDGSIARRLAKDPGAAGQRRAAGVRASIGKPEAKRAAWAALAHANPPAANAVQYEIAAGFTRCVDPAILSGLVDTVLGELRDYYAANEGWVGARVARTVFPTWAAGRVDGLASRIERWLEDNADAPSVLRKIVTEGLDEVYRALAAQSATARG